VRPGAILAANHAVRFLLELAALAAALLAVQTSVFAAAAVALAAAGRTVLAVAFALVVAVNTVLLHLLDGEPKP
jgi:hypothetical protein